MTIKTIYGRQQGAEFGHNPHKPGGPSHACHSYSSWPIRGSVSGVEVLGGKEHTARQALPGLWSLLEQLPRTHIGRQWCGAICGYGNEVLLQAAQERGLRRLFKLRHTVKVKNPHRAGAAGRRLVGRGGRGLGGDDGGPALERVEPPTAGRARARSAGRGAGGPPGAAAAAARSSERCAARQRTRFMANLVALVCN